MKHSKPLEPLRKARLISFSIFLLLGSAGSAHAVITQIGAMTNPNVVIDFGSFGTGATSVAAINAAAPGAGITSITFNEVAGTGVYDTDLGSGNALAADGSGGLTIVPENGSYANADQLTIVLDHLVTQFGFQLADRSESTLELFNGAVSVGSIATPNILTPPVTDFFASTLAFNRIVISQGPNWVIPELVIEVNAVPAPPTLALALAGLVAGRAARRRRD